MAKEATKAVVLHSGGMDSSLTLWLAMNELGKDNVLALCFNYGQRHVEEIERATRICQAWGIKQKILEFSVLQQITSNALMDPSIPIHHPEGEAPNTLVVGRNGLFVRLGAIYADHVGAEQVWIGVQQADKANSGYRDCSRSYMDLMQQILRIDMANPRFSIRTPLVEMFKLDTMKLAYSLGILDFLLRETLTCYAGVLEGGCGKCPSCLLRKEGLNQFRAQLPFLG